LRARGRGSYRVLDKVGQDRYQIQKIPTLPHFKRQPGKVKIEMGWRLELIPSTVILHKRLDSTDNRWIRINTEFKHNPLEENLGFIDFGRFSRHAGDGTHAFDKVQESDDWILDPESSDEEDVLFQEGDDTEVQDDSPTPEPLRKRQKTATTVLQSTKGPSVTIVPPVTSDQLKLQLWYETERSKDKLFLTARTREGFKRKSWHVVQVSLEDTDMEAARKHGRYHVLYYIRALADSKKFKGRYCNYWPEIHEFRRDGESMGAMVPTRPNKVMRLLETKPDRYMWYQDTIDLFSARNYGPFDFVEDHKIREAAWNVLLDRADTLHIYINNVLKVKPLDQHDREDTDASGNSFCHVKRKWKLQEDFQAC
jgi:hypothetical protein